VSVASLVATLSADEIRNRNADGSETVRESDVLILHSGLITSRVSLKKTTPASKVVPSDGTTICSTGCRLVFSPMDVRRALLAEWMRTVPTAELTDRTGSTRTIVAVGCAARVPKGYLVYAPWLLAKEHCLQLTVGDPPSHRQVDFTEVDRLSASGRQVTVTLKTGAVVAGTLEPRTVKGLDSRLDLVSTFEGYVDAPEGDNLLEPFRIDVTDVREVVFKW
jgi:hypothetical protein